MARKKSPTLTEAELRLMEILWDKGSATVGDIVAALPKRKGLAYSTVLTTMRILDQKDYVRHEKDGRAFVYHPLVDRSQARKGALKFVMKQFFEGSPELLVMSVLDDESIDPKELRRLKRLIEKGK